MWKYMFKLIHTLCFIFFALICCAKDVMTYWWSLGRGHWSLKEPSFLRPVESAVMSQPAYIIWTRKSGQKVHATAKSAA